ncbi:hypothetical protein N7562_06830 [Acinetobacter soli]|uniref:hypothetical protein n=1 Tax=Acinetobacter soli TaxID=487316 RepID=UPI00287D6CF2|nr:hypothetical protein [Acinetobacter soli]MDS7693898.1 hypothetical protein [Acinetobacter soli]
MVNKTLQEKLEFVCFRVFGGAFWYMLISFFLLSDYPIQNYPFDHKKAYEILRDTLTLSAYFLAPGIAWALVTDWKYQHHAIERHNFFNEIDFQLHELHRISQDFFLDITQRTILNEDVEIIWRDKAFNIFGEVNKVNNKFKSIEIMDSSGFMKQAEELIGAFNSVGVQFQFVLADYFELKNTSSDIKNDFSNYTFKRNVDSLNKNLDQIKDKLNVLKELKPDL